VEVHSFPRRDPRLVREKVPEVRSNWLTKVFALFAGIFAAIGSFFDGVLGNLHAARDYIEPLTSMFWDRLSGRALPMRNRLWAFNRCPSYAFGLKWAEVLHLGRKSADLCRRSKVA
jgi:hypothetical protein